MVGKLDCMPGGVIGCTEYFVDGGIVLLLGVIEEAEGVIKAKRRLRAELRLEGNESRGRLSHRGGCECGGRADDGSEAGGLHGREKTESVICVAR